MEYSSSENFLLKPLKITIIWPSFCKNRVHKGHVQNKKTIFFSEITKPDQKHFILLKYHMFWLSYECFSVLLYDAFLLKSVISSHNSFSLLQLRIDFPYFYLNLLNFSDKLISFAFMLLTKLEFLSVNSWISSSLLTFLYWLQVKTIIDIFSIQITTKGLKKWEKIEIDTYLTAFIKQT